jgi:hypothetical protein
MCYCILSRATKRNIVKALHQYTRGGMLQNFLPHSRRGNLHTFPSLYTLPVTHRKISKVESLLQHILYRHVDMLCHWSWLSLQLDAFQTTNTYHTCTNPNLNSNIFSVTSNIIPVVLSVSVNTQPRAVPLRLFFLCWVRYNVAISTVFRAYLTTFLIEPGYKQSIKTVKKILASDMIFVSCKDTRYSSPILPTPLTLLFSKTQYVAVFTIPI